MPKVYSEDIGRIDESLEGVDGAAGRATYKGHWLRANL